MEQTNREKLSYYWRFILMIVGWFNLILTLLIRIFVLETDGSLFLAIIRPYKYYTMQTNLIVCIWLTISIILQNKREKFKKINGGLKGAILSYIMVTFLIYAILLDGLYTPDKWYNWIIDISTHYVVPIAFLIGWIIDSGEKYRWISLVYWIIYPHCYMGFALIHGAFSGDYLYPFLNVEVIGIGGLLIWYSILVGIFLTLGSIFIGINRFMWKKREEHPQKTVD